MAMLNNQRVYETYMPKDAFYIYTFIWHMAWLWHHVLIISIVVPNSGQRLFTESPTLRPLRSGSGSSIHLGVYFMEIPIENGWELRVPPWLRKASFCDISYVAIRKKTFAKIPRRLSTQYFSHHEAPCVWMTRPSCRSVASVPKNSRECLQIQTFPVTNPLKQRFGIGIHEPPTMVQDSKWHLLLVHCSIGFLFLGTFHWKGLKELQ